MADKKPKKASSSRIPLDKLLTVKPELVTPSQLVKFDPHQITTVNFPDKPSSSKMVSLGKPAQSTSFAKALTSSYDPFNKHIVPSTPVAPIKTKNAKTSPFHPLYDEKLFHIEFIHRSITNPLHLIRAYFPTHPSDGAQQHFSPTDQNKTIQYYQNILQQEGSIIIKAIHNQFTPKREILYHKIKIIKFTSFRNWGTHPNILKPLKNTPSHIHIMIILMPGIKYFCINMMICLIPGSFNGMRNIILLNQNANHPCGLLNGGLSMAPKMRSSLIPCGIPGFQSNLMIHQ